MGFHSPHSTLRLRWQQYVIFAILTASFPLVLADVPDIATGPRVTSASERPHYDIRTSRACSGLLTDVCPLCRRVKHALLHVFCNLTCDKLRDLWSVSSAYSCQGRWASSGWGRTLCPNSQRCSRPTTRHVRQYVILPLQAGSFPLIFLPGIPDVSQLRQQTDVVMSIIGASEVDINVCGQGLASRILAVWPDRPRPPLQLCVEIHIRAVGSQGRVSDYTPHVQNVPRLYAIRKHRHTWTLSVRIMLA